MSRFSLRIIKNAASNLVRGCSTAVVSFALPHFLTRALDVNRFAAWSLMLQIAAYASFLDFGLQMAVARFVAHSTELNQVRRRRLVIQTALSLLLVAALLALSVIAVVLYQAKSIFHGISPEILREFQFAGLILGSGTAMQLVFSAFSGTLVGLHRNEYVAAATAGGRVIGAIAVIVLSRFTHSLIVLASAITVSTVIAGLLQWLAVVRLLPELSRLHLTLDREVTAALYNFCIGLTAWMFGMFMVSGLDVTIVGRFRFVEVGCYSIAASAAAMLVGLNNAVLSALLAPLSASHAKNDRPRISTVTLEVSWANTLVNGLILIAFVLMGGWILRVWVGPNYANRTIDILLVLLVAQAIRLIASPFAIMLISCGLHAKGVVSGLVEGAVNLGFSCYFVRIYGAIGVAYGTLIGAVVSLLVHFFYTLRKVDAIPLRRLDLVIWAAGLPLVSLFPFGLFSVLVRRGYFRIESPGLIVSVLCTVAIVAWTWQSRQLIRSWLSEYARHYTKAVR